MSTNIIFRKSTQRHFVNGAYVPTRTLEIERDPMPLNPRKTRLDLLGKMVCFHKRHLLGDNHILNKEDYKSWDDVKNHLVTKCDAVVVLPLYIHEHSGITIRTTRFTDPWDSGQIGFIYASAKQIDARLGWDARKLTDAQIWWIKLGLEGEVYDYNAYLQGEVYCWTIRDSNGEFVDGDCGYYGYPHGVYDILAIHGFNRRNLE